MTPRPQSHLLAISLILALSPISTISAITPTHALPDDPKKPFAGWHLAPSFNYITGLQDWGDDLGTGLQAGYLFARDNLRDGIHLDLTHAELDARGGQRELSLLTAHASYQAGLVITEHWFFSVGAGLGVAWTEFTAKNLFSSRDSTLSWHVFTGIEYRPIHFLGIRAGYRHLWIDQLSTPEGNMKRADASLFEAGVTFWF